MTAQIFYFILIIVSITLFQAVEGGVGGGNGDRPASVQSASRSTSGSDLRQISVLERLTKTHPIWYLPQVGRSGAVHLLKDRDTGVSWVVFHSLVLFERLSLFLASIWLYHCSQSAYSQGAF